MKTTLAFIVAALHFQIVTAQTNSPTVSTNLVEAAPNFRRVNGQLYNTERSKLWIKMGGEVDSKKNGVVILQTYVTHKEPIRERVRLNGLQSSGGYAGGPDTGTSYRTWKERDKSIAVTNLYDFDNIVSGQEFEVLLMRTGVFNNDNGDTLELWDRGTVNIVSVVTTNDLSKKAPSTGLKK